MCFYLIGNTTKHKCDGGRQAVCNEYVETVDEVYAWKQLPGQALYREWLSGGKA